MATHTLVNDLPVHILLLRPRPTDRVCMYRQRVRRVVRPPVSKVVLEISVYFSNFNIETTFGTGSTAYVLKTVYNIL